jgi:superfamily II DNA or RNA helicase
MLARIFDNHHIYLEQITQGSEESIIDWFSVREPNAFFVKSELWDGWHRKYNTVKQRLALPFLNELQTCCDVKGIPLQISDERPAPKYPAPQPEQITETFLDGVTLEEYQVRILRAICSEEIGIISATTGSGKTEIMCGIVKMFRCPTVIITEQIVVLEQIVQRLQLRNVVHNNDIGMFCYGNMPNGNIVIVGSIQSLSTPTVPKKDKVGVNRKKLLKKVHEWADLQDECLLTVFPRVLAEALYANPSGAYQIQGKYYLLLRDYYVEMEYERQLAAYKTRITNCRKIQDMVKKSDLMLVDECDLATSDQYGMMFRYYFNGRRRYGFSGTPFDSKKQVNNIKLKENLGNIIGEADRNEVQSAGRIVPVRCYFIGVGVGGDRTDSRAFDIALKEEIEENS